MSMRKERLPPKSVAFLATAVLAAATLVLGCQGEKSSDPPVHLNLNMDFQAKFRPQSKNDFFLDQRASRPPVAGTIAIGELEEDAHLYEGKVDGAWAKELPAALAKDAKATLARGKERYDIYCRVCHGGLGDGKGMATTRNMAVQPTSYFDPRVMGMALGEFFEIISNGRRNMPPLRYQIPAADRWAIAAYVRVLQRSVSGLAPRDDSRGAP